MTLPTVHVIAGFAGGDGKTPSEKQPIFKGPHKWSEEVATGTKSSNQAPDLDGMRPVLRITLQVDVFFAHGANPDPTASPRHLLMAADSPHDLYVEPGDYHKWTAAT